jgi:ribosome-associated protein
MTCNSARHIESLSYDIEMLLHQKGCMMLRKEGIPTSGWLILDYSGVVIHLFEEDKRSYYNLEDVWSSASEIVRIL